MRANSLYFYCIVLLFSCNDFTTTESKKSESVLSRTDTAKDKSSIPESTLINSAEKIKEIDFSRIPVRLSHKINTSANEAYPLLDKSGEKIIFSGMDRTGFFDYKLDFIKSSNCGGEDIFISDCNDGIWSDARPISFLNTNAHECATHILGDGSLIISGSYDENIGFTDNPDVNTTDIFKAEITPDGYRVQHYDEPINSMYTEGDGYLFNDKFMIFISDRPDCIGSYHKKGWYWEDNYWGNTDVWVSEYSNYMWNEPINLGPIVNTPGAERSPWISDDGLTLYVSSNGFDSSKNDLDIYMFKREDINNWQEWDGPYKVVDACSDYDDWGYKIHPKKGAYFSRSLILPFKTSSPVRAGDGGGIRETNYRTGYKVKGAQVGSYKKENQTDIFLLQEKNTPILTLKDVQFKINQYELSKSAYNYLEDLIDVIKLNNPNKIIINGYTDDTGSSEFNLNLSYNRAESVKSYLLENGIVNTIEINGKGEDNPLYPNTSKSNQELNRRVEIIFEI